VKGLSAASRKRKLSRKTLIYTLAGTLAALIVVAAIVWAVLPGASSRSGAADLAAGTDAASGSGPVLGVRFHPRMMRFGIFLPREVDPLHLQRPKQLTGKEDGRTNNTCVLVDLFPYLFGQDPGIWPSEEGRSLRWAPLKGRTGWVSIMDFPEKKVRVHQTIEIIANEQTHRLDTCLILYRIDNRDQKAHQVALRVMLDTYVGSTDSVPYAVPGQPGLVDTMCQLAKPHLPDFIQALERSDFRDPGVVAQIGLVPPRIKGLPDDVDAEGPAEVLLCRWPGADIKWQWTPRPINEAQPGESAEKDACVALYWPERGLPARANRVIAFTYGLGTLSSSGSGNGELALTAGGSFQPGGEFTVMAYVKPPRVGQRVRLALPEGMHFVSGPGAEPAAEERVVAKGVEYSQVAWRIRIDDQVRPGVYFLAATSESAQERLAVRVGKEA
jgi:hypothetical protein